MNVRDYQILFVLCFLAVFAAIALPALGAERECLDEVEFHVERFMLNAEDVGRFQGLSYKILRLWRTEDGVMGQCYILIDQNEICRTSCGGKYQGSGPIGPFSKIR